METLPKMARRRGVPGAADFEFLRNALKAYMVSLPFLLIIQLLPPPRGILRREVIKFIKLLISRLFYKYVTD